MIFETERLILRELRISDAEKFFQLNSDAEVLKYTGDKPFKNIKEAELFLIKYDAYQKTGFGRWAVELKENNTFIGWCGLKLNEQNQIDVGFRFHKKYWGQGFASESARASLNIGFNEYKLDQIIGRAASENVASIRVLEKIGMTPWKLDECKGIPKAQYFKISRKRFNDNRKSSK